MKKAKIVLCLRSTYKGSVVWVDGFARPWCNIEMKMNKHKTTFKLTRMVGGDGCIVEDHKPIIEEFEAAPLIVLTLPEGVDPFQLFSPFANGFRPDYSRMDIVTTPTGDLNVHPGH